NTATLGGGAFNNAASNSPTPAVPGNLTIVNCTVSNNTSASSGGAIQNFSTSTLTILNSTFTGNTSTGGVGGGAIAANGGLRVSNSTFSGNAATTDPGGAIQSNGTLGLVLTNVTITGNTAATTGGGLHRGTTNANSAIRNSIIAGNTGGASPDVSNSAGGLVSQGNNIIGTTGTSTGWIGSDLLNTNPIVGPLGDYGGIVRTVPLLEGSPAINAGQNCVIDLTCSASNPPFPITTDARYVGRGTVDIGAYEVSVASRAVLPNAGLNQAYTHVIAPSSTGFTFAATGDVPPGLSISNAGGQAVLSGTPTSPGTYIFTITVNSDANPTQSRAQLYMLTVSADPGNSFLLLKFTGEFGEILNSPTSVTLTDLQGNVRIARLSPFGYAQFDNLPTGGAFALQVNNKTYGANSIRTFSILGSVIVELSVESRTQQLPKRR
ncbi:MAG TPA: choice-of-anchor Q domain-containing protein, partial [Pyrinomonadaceae bacterium]